MRRLFTFSIFCLLSATSIFANNNPIDNYIDIKTQNSSSLYSLEIEEVSNWLINGSFVSPNFKGSSLNSACTDSAGTSIRTINGTPMGATTIANFGDLISIVHNLDSIVANDGNITTTPGVDIGIYQNGLPTVKGPTAAAIVADNANLNPMGLDLVNTDLSGSISFNSGNTYQNTYNSGNPVQLWFAHVTLDDHANQDLTENAGAADECAHVNTDDVFSIIFLNELDTAGLVTPYPVSNSNLCQARIILRGGLPQWDASTYNINIELVGNSAVTGTIDPTTQNVFHNSQLIFTVPQPGNYNLIVSDNNGGLDTFVIDMSACITCTDDAGTLTTALGSTAQSNSNMVLCAGDSLSFTHDGNADLLGDPDGTTPSGVQYAIYTCAPTKTGPQLDTIKADPCIILDALNVAPVLVSDVDMAGDGFIYNDGILYQNMLGGPGVVGQLWFAPITVDRYVLNASGWEGVNGPNECTNVNINAAFPVTFLNEISANNFSAMMCNGSFDVTGGLPQFDGSAYNVAIELSTDATITGTVTNSPITHNGTVNFTVPQPGLYNITVTDANGCGSISGTNTFSLNMNTCPFPCTGVVNSTATISSPISCNGANDGEIAISTIGGVAPLTYTWSHDNTLTLDTAKNLGTGNYTITVTDANGCADTVVTTLTEPAILFVTLDEENPLCNGEASGIVNVDNVGGGTAPFSYAWSGGTPNTAGDTITGLVAGSYSVTVTDANGCMATASTGIGDPAALVASFTGSINTDCAASANGSAVITPSGGTHVNTIYTYTWDHDALLNDSTATGLTVGTYYVTVTDDNGCMVNDSVTIGADKTILNDLDSVDISCYGGSDGMATVSTTTLGGTANTPYSYAWSHDMTLNNDTATNLLAGTYIVTVTDAVGCFAIDSIVINEPDSIDITTQNITNVICFGDNTGAASVMVTGGTPNYTYSWDNDPSTSASISGVTAGDYTVYVTDSRGCMDSLTVTIAEADSFYISQIDTTSLNCAGDMNGGFMITMTGGAMPYSYQWSTNPAVDTLNAISNIGAGTYTVTITDANNCIITQTLDLVDPPLLTGMTAGQDQSCATTADGMAYIIASGGTAPYTYQWNNNGLTDTIKNLLAGFYQVTVTDATGCTYIDSVSVNSPPAINIALTTTPVSCPGGFDGTASATVTGGTGGFTYLWDSTQTGQTASLLSAGQHVLIVTDQSGCQMVDSFMINEIPRMVPVVVSTEPVNCRGGNDGTATIGVSGGTPPYNYSWNTTPVQDSSTAINLTAGAYEVIVTDANGCTLPPISITVNEPTRDLTASIDAVEPSCAGEANGTATALPLGGTSSYTYLWSDGQTAATATNLSAGNYTVTVTDANGCTTTASTALNEPFPLFVQLSATPTTCNGGKDGRIEIDTVIGGTGPYSYSIDGVNFLPIDVTYFGLFGGNYVVEVKDSMGCIYEEDVLIVEPPLITVDLGPDVTLSLGDTVQLDAIVNTADTLTYNWLPADSAHLSCLDCYNPIASPTTTTEYTVLVSDANGCISTDLIRIEVKKSRRVFIPTAFTPNGDGRNDKLIIYGGTGVTNINQFMVYDRWGELVFSAKDFIPGSPTNGWDGRVGGKDMPMGVYVYFVEVEFADGQVLPYKGDFTLIR